MPDNSRSSNPRWVLANQVADAVLERHPDEVLAIGVHGSLAHGDDTEYSDVDIVVVTFGPGTGPRPATRRIGRVVVDLGVITADEYLRHARTLSTSWPLAADQYLNTGLLYDPRSWFERLRDTHLARLAEAGHGEFVILAREAWCQADAALAKATRLASAYDMDAAMLVAGQSRLSAALVDGLLARTYFRNGADAVTRSGVAGMNLMELADKLAAQAEELDRRGRPVHGCVDDLFL
ncbi:MAG TPA: nucleotidyltransferase domain-containing protein [Micromonosporaceae bacterium]